MTDRRSDASLVGEYLAGDRQALAAIYDRYAGALYDTAAAMLRDRHEAADATQDVFVTAAERLGQLRDGDRLKAWLFAILRNGVYRRANRRQRSRPTDFADPETASTTMSDSSDHTNGATVDTAALAADVRAAAAGLDARDQLVLELVARQGLQGEDLAAALGVPVSRSYVLVHRMRQRVERSLGALVVARAGRSDCTELAAMLRGWDGRFDVKLRKRVARHVDGCDTCDATKRRVGVVAMASAAPVFALPAGLRDRVLAGVEASAAEQPGPSERDGWGDDGFPPHHGTGHARSRLLRGTALSTAAGIVGIAVVLAVVGDRGNFESSIATLPTVAVSAPAPASSPPPIATPQTTPEPAGPTVASTAAPVVVDPTTTPTTPTTTSTIPPSTPSSTGPPLKSAPVLVAPTHGDTGPPPTNAPVLVAPTQADNDPPRVTIVSSPSALTCPWSVPPNVTVDVADASTVDSVVLAWSGPGGSGEKAMTRGSDSRWSGELDIAPVDGVSRFVVTATDAAGNNGTASDTVTVTGC